MFWGHSRGKRVGRQARKSRHIRPAIGPIPRELAKPGQSPGAGHQAMWCRFTSSASAGKMAVIFVPKALE